MRLAHWAWFGAVVALTACGPGANAPMSAFEGRLADWTQEILRDSPELASQAGVTAEIAGGPYADRLDDRSAIAVEARRSAALRRYAELLALDANDFDASEQLTVSVLRVKFENDAAGAAFNYGDFSQGGIQPYVLNQLDSAYLELPDFLEHRHAVTNLTDAENYIVRLQAVAPALDAETARSRADAQLGVVPPRFIIDTTIQQLDFIASQPVGQQAYISGFRGKLDALVAAESDANARAQLQMRTQGVLARAEAIVRDDIIPAHQRAAQWLRSVRPNAPEQGGMWSLPQGEDYYRAALRIETTTDLTPDQIHQIGLERVAVLTRELDVALRRIGQTEGPVGQRLALITADPRYQYPDSDEGRAQLLADIRARMARVLERAPEWFGTLPRARFEVQRVPAFAEASQPGASYSAPSLDGSTPGVYHINLRNLGEMTRIDVPTQDFHEAVPGHHFQMALAQEQTDTPLLRRLTAFGAYGEGWGLYAEELADELGFHEGDPVGRIGFLRWQLWRAARLVVDTGLHAKRWTRQQAIDYMSSVTGDAPGVIATEVDRYIVWPGQACSYEIGRRQIMALREEARSTLGPDFDLKGFHDVVLLNGEVPLNVLAELVRAWIPERQRAAARARRE
ncbi:protein of unknown function DUF885 [alpha proteobacterium U9-1i]|nr:protein of unknown function DUF885 [alpha proteobacterium U9-1i]